MSISTEENENVYLWRAKMYKMFKVNLLWESKVNLLYTVACTVNSITNSTNDDEKLKMIVRRSTLSHFKA